MDLAGGRNGRENEFTTKGTKGILWVRGGALVERRPPLLPGEEHFTAESAEVFAKDANLDRSHYGLLWSGKVKVCGERSGRVTSTGRAWLKVHRESC